MSSFITKTKKTILILGDIGLLYLSLYLTLLARYGWTLELDIWSRHLVPFSIIFLTWLVVFFINDFYDLKTSYNVSNLFNALTRIFIINGAIAVTLFYFFAPFIDSIKPQRVLIIDIIITIILIFIWKILAETTGKFTPQSEITKFFWVSGDWENQNIKLASILRKGILPELVKRNLI